MGKYGMSKTITLENPITAIGRFFARRSILKMQKKIAKLEAKYFSEASENTTETKTLNYDVNGNLINITKS